MSTDDITKLTVIATFFKSLPKDEMKITGSQVIELQVKPFRKHQLTHLMDVWGKSEKHLKFLENGDLNIERVTSKQQLVLSLSV